jgi:prepilin signal peptidase PulO-like enzyme (type II secretory pathway)
MTWAQHLIVASFLFVLGASCGSFLNVCLYRIPLGASVLRPASRCPRCGRSIALYDNIPILGWLLLRGRCRACSQPISARYPVVEALCGLLPASGYLLAQAVIGGDPLEANPLHFLVWLVLEFSTSVALVGLGFAGYDALHRGHAPSVSVAIASAEESTTRM